MRDVGCVMSVGSYGYDCWTTHCFFLEQDLKILKDLKILLAVDVQCLHALAIRQSLGRVTGSCRHGR